MSTITAPSSALLLLGAALTLGVGAPPKPPPALRPVSPEALNLPERSSWQPPVFVRADRRGAVFLLVGSDLQALPLLPNGKLGEPASHETARSPNGPPLRVALSRDGDWLVLAPPDVRLLRAGKQKVLPNLDWLPIDVGFLRDDPVVNSNGVRLTPSPRGARKEDPPLVLRFTGNVWEPFIREAIPSKLDPLEAKVHELRSVHLLGDSRGTLWLANEYLYRVRRYNSAGRLLLELSLGPQKLDPRADAQKRQKSFERSTQGRLNGAGSRAVAQASTSRRVILAMTEGRDGRLYLLVSEPSTEGGIALDRFDPALQRIERVPLALQASGYLSIAAGKDGLYVAAFTPGLGPWKIDWSDLDAAHWKPLRNVEIDRQVQLTEDERGER